MPAMRSRHLRLISRARAGPWYVQATHRARVDRHDLDLLVPQILRERQPTSQPIVHAGGAAKVQLTYFSVLAAECVTTMFVFL